MPVVGTSEDRLDPFKKWLQPLLNEAIPVWRKRAVFTLELAVIIFGVVHFCVYFDPIEATRQLYLSFAAMLAVTAVTQLICCWFVFSRAVPVYVWTACAAWVFSTLFWQGLVVVLLSVA
ncbi:MAG: hypothetical protein CVV16_04865 [Gammaproteobacteria bacterium HGW-Gammaproteobacteria-6]|nr:MAG: hypothetical protein CVV16_04865 [Gammaproteobacteria bacterium HGW-Gammaproteobacteria-6]